jgi:hypothetical protein
MDAMSWQLISLDAFNTSFSQHFESGPVSTIGQLTISSYHDETDPNDSHAGFDNCEFIDDNGIQRSRILNSIGSFSQNNMVRVDFSGFVGNGGTTFMMNLFFWPGVS